MFNQVHTITAAMDPTEMAMLASGITLAGTVVLIVISWAITKFLQILIARKKGIDLPRGYFEKIDNLTAVTAVVVVVMLAVGLVASFVYPSIEKTAQAIEDYELCVDNSTDPDTECTPPEWYSE